MNALKKSALSATGIATRSISGLHHANSFPKAGYPLHMGRRASFPREMILAHRGDWVSGLKPNSVDALSFAVSKGYGFETDIRDFGGNLVISHDFADNLSPQLEEILSFLAKSQARGVFALNIKSDGMTDALLNAVKSLSQLDSFFFDMSFPEMIRYERAGLPLARRVSEYEGKLSPAHALTGQNVANIWLDSFDSDWWLDEDWSSLSPGEERVFFVSPEIHGRNHKGAWQRLEEFFGEGRTFGICTDLPDEFLKFMET